jgi:hypothetical protein
MEEKLSTTRGGLARSRLRLLAGHIYYISGVECQNQNSARESAVDYEKAVQSFEWVMENEANKDSKFALYAMFGFSQAQFAINANNIENIGEKLRRVRDHFRLDADNREELRSKATSRAVEYVCEKLMCECSPEDISQLYRSIIDLIGRVDHTATIYSPISKRNVDKATFILDIDSI